MAWAGIAIGVGALGAGIAGAVSGPDAPDAPNYAAASRAGIEADVETLGTRRKTDAAARLGGELVKKGYKRTFGGDVAALTAQQQAKLATLQQSESQLAQQLAAAQALPDSPNSATRQQRLDQINAAQNRLDAVRADLRAANAALASIQTNQGEAIYTDPDGNVVTREAALDEDFAGYGDADVQSAYARQMAESILKNQKELGPEFIATAREQLKQADPEGFAAREKLYGEILAQMGRTQDEPIADSLEAQILSELNKGASVDEGVAREIEQALTAQQAERGGGYGKADEYQQALNTGMAAEARRAQRQQKAAAFLSGGYSKKDRDYKKSQQDMANLSAFLTGQTPTAQFQQLSGAQNGAAPFVNSPGGPVTNPNAGAQGAAFAQGNWQTQMNNQPANPYLAGLGLAGQTLGTVATVGGPQGFGWWGRGGGGVRGGWTGSIPQGQV